MYFGRGYGEYLLALMMANIFSFDMNFDVTSYFSFPGLNDVSRTLLYWEHEGEDNEPKHAIPPVELEERVLTLSDGTRIKFWNSQKEDKNLPVVVFFGGNAARTGTVVLSNLYKSLYKLPVQVVLADYPGFGNSDGKPSEKSLTETGTRVIKWSYAHFKTPVFLMGHSLGAGVAMQTVKNTQKLVKGLILLNPWNSFHRLTLDYYIPNLLDGWTDNWIMGKIEDEYDSMAVARTLNIPAMIIVGDDDYVIPAYYGKVLSGHFREDLVTLIEFDNWGHNNIYFTSVDSNEPSDKRFWSEFKQFVLK